MKKDKGKQKKVTVKTWSKDIVCLPVDYHSQSQELPFPRGSRRAQLAKSGLIGKVSLSSTMSEADMRAEICSVFSAAFGEENNFPFKFLQMIGGGARCLTVPCTSPTFEWTAQDVASSAGKGAVYILAEKQTIAPDGELECDSNEGSSWRYASTYYSYDCKYWISKYLTLTILLSLGILYIYIHTDVHIYIGKTSLIQSMWMQCTLYSRQIHQCAWLTRKGSCQHPNQPGMRRL